MKFSAHTELKGVIVLEPITLNEPTRISVVVVAVDVDVVVFVVVDVVVAVLPQPASIMTAASISVSGKNHFTLDLNKFFSFFYSILFC
jgi:hypothetical protein